MSDEVSRECRTEGVNIGQECQKGLYPSCGRLTPMGNYGGPKGSVSPRGAPEVGGNWHCAAHPPELGESVYITSHHITGG